MAEDRELRLSIETIRSDDGDADDTMHSEEDPLLSPSNTSAHIFPAADVSLVSRSTDDPILVRLVTREDRSRLRHEIRLQGGVSRGPLGIINEIIKVWRCVKASLLSQARGESDTGTRVYIAEKSNGSETVVVGTAIRQSLLTEGGGDCLLSVSSHEKGDERSKALSALSSAVERDATAAKFSMLWYRTKDPAVQSVMQSLGYSVTEEVIPGDPSLSYGYTGVVLSKRMEQG